MKTVKQRLKDLERKSMFYDEAVIYISQDNGMHKKLNDIAEEYANGELKENVSAMKNAHRRNVILTLAGFFLISLHFFYFHLRD